MNNYVYIVSSLPVLLADLKPGAALDSEELITGIKDQCSERDRATIDFLLEGFEPERLDRDFYLKALAHPSRFIRGYFGFDLDVRNARAAFLNKALERAEGLDLITLGEEPREAEDPARIAAILACDDILEREKSLDLLMWEKADSLTIFDYFDLDLILAFIAKLRIASRWAALDEKTGREMFRKLTEDVRATFKGVEFDS